MLRLLRRSRAVAGFRAGLRSAVLLAALGATSCGAWQRQTPHDVAGLTDPQATYVIVLRTLQDEKYTIIDQDAAERSVRVRSHLHEDSPEHVSVILLHVSGTSVYLSASGYLVRADGTTHHALNSELAMLHNALQKRIAANGQNAANGAATQPSGSAALVGSLPLAWTEPASDQSVWGHGVFTCLPIKLADEEQTQLSLKLSNGETADVLLSLAHAPELCRSPAQCKLAGGCPALGIADADRVSRLAGRLSKHEIGALATLFSRGQPIAMIDLGKHGSIAQAMAEKH
ncbi:MAG: hypothetical protein WDO69_01945 [Pseudomonadota bacterium]